MAAANPRAVAGRTAVVQILRNKMISQCLGVRVGLGGCTGLPMTPYILTMA